MEIGKNIRAIREFKKMSAKELADKIGMGPSQYSRIELGKTDPSVGTLVKIAKGMNVNCQ